MTRIVCISDTHLIHRDCKVSIPPGDLLIHAGDATFMGSIEEIQEFNAWFSHLPHRHKIFVAGNHDWGFQLSPTEARAHLASEIHYLEDSETHVEGLHIYGSPWQPQFQAWAFNLDRGEPLHEKWTHIPTGVDVLITHGPPAGILDRTTSGHAVGCKDLYLEVASRIRPKVHIFGHIHEAYGQRSLDGTTFVNACIVDKSYRLANDPVVIDLP